MKILLDNGHGAETKGKRSPVWSDGTQLFEYEFNRDIVKRLSILLDQNGIDYVVLVPELNDVPLNERCDRANKIYDETNGDCVLFSIHSNAGGGTGLEFYTTRGETKSDEIATILYENAKQEFEKDGYKMRHDLSDGDVDKEADFYILRHTKAPAVLAEWFFMDTEKDCKFIMSNEGRERIAKVMLKTIQEIL